MTSELIRDLRSALRGLAKRPGFAAVAVLTLALGIGANSAVFSLVNTVLLRPLPYSDPERLVKLWQTFPGRGIEEAPVSPLNFIDWRDQSEGFEHLAAFVPAIYSLIDAGSPEQVWGAEVSAELFRLLGVEAWQGRTLAPGEDRPEAPRVAVVAEELWRRVFGADPGLLGRTIRLDGHPYEVVGIMPAGFSFVDRAEIWTPLVFNREDLGHRGRLFLEVIGRLRPGHTLVQAREEMAGLTATLSEQYFGGREVVGVRLAPLAEAVVGEARRALLILAGVVGFVLLIACANVANLTLARTGSRLTELAMRVSLGAGRARLIRLMLTESVLLAAMGGLAGLALAVGIAEFLRSNAIDLPRLEEIGIDGRVVGFTSLTSMSTGVLCGLIPALLSSRPNLSEVLKAGGGKTTGGRGHRLTRHLLVALEVAVAFLVLIGAGLMVRSFQRVQAVDPGFEIERVLAMSLVEPENRFTDDAQRLFFYRQIRERLAAVPQVRSAGIATSMPIGGGRRGRTSFQPQGLVPIPGELPPVANIDGVDPSYFLALGIPIVQGRGFDSRDGNGGAAVAIVDETLARRWWPGENPIGKRLLISGLADNDREVVGVARRLQRFGLEATPEPQIYLPFSDYIQGWVSFLVRTEGEPQQLAEAMRAAVWGIDRNQPIAVLSTMEELLRESLSRRRFITRITGLFAVLALALALIGIHGVLSYSVSQRTQEIGVRRALGAGRRKVLGLVVGQGMRWTGIGLGVGLVAALTLTRLLDSILFEVTATDPTTFVAVALLFIAVALAATLAPAWRALRIDPVAALRYE